MKLRFDEAATGFLNQTFAKEVCFDLVQKTVDKGRRLRRRKGFGQFNVLVHRYFDRYIRQ